MLPSRLHHDVALAAGVVDRADHLALRRQRSVPEVVRLVDGALPGGDVAGEGDVRAVAVERRGKC
nr:hypothetical protein GCM10020092_048650 [Actinoplanes digitatis]